MQQLARLHVRRSVEVERGAARQPPEQRSLRQPRLKA
jgi:hypothetical protein